MLVGGGEAGEQRNDPRGAQFSTFQGVTCVADILFRRHKDQDIAPAVFFAQPLHGFNGHFDMGELFFRWLHIARFNGIHAPGNFDDRRMVESIGKLLCVDGGRGDDDFQIPSAF